LKWYTSEGDFSPIISCRVRLARNFEKYNFYSKLTQKEATEMIEEISKNLLGEKDINFRFINLSNKTDIESLGLVEHHKISLDLLKSREPKAVISSEDDSIHIMINEEDHVRIQCIAAGKNIQKSYTTADYVDDLIEKNLKYAFDEKLGYLTSCPSNIGTGMRASYMVHLPMLEKAGKLHSVITYLSRSGMTIRGIYGESSEPIGSIYQISNQCSLGRSEPEIINILENLTNQIVETELETLEKYVQKNRIFFEDHIYRAYGVLKNCRQIEIGEARNLLSILRLGVVSGTLKDNIKTSVYSIMMNIEYGNLKINTGNISDKEINEARATFIRKCLENSNL